MLSAAFLSEGNHPTSLHNELLKNKRVSTWSEGLCGHVEEPPRMRAPQPLGHWEGEVLGRRENEGDLPTELGFTVGDKQWEGGNLLSTNLCRAIGNQIMKKLS